MEPDKTNKWLSNAFSSSEWNGECSCGNLRVTIERLSQKLELFNQQLSSYNKRVESELAMKAQAETKARHIQDEVWNDFYILEKVLREWKQLALMSRKESESIVGTDTLDGHKDE